MKRLDDKKRAKDLETIIVLAAASVLLYIIFKNSLFLAIAFSLLAAGLFLKRLASLISDLWLRFSKVISSINSTVVLFMVYYLVLTPVALLYRVFAKNPLQLKKDSASASYFFEREHSFGKEDFEKMW